MGFKEASRSEVFGEVTLRAAAEDLAAWLETETEGAVERTLDEEDDPGPPRRAAAVCGPQAA